MIAELDRTGDLEHTDTGPLLIDTCLERTRTGFRERSDAIHRTAPTRGGRGAITDKTWNDGNRCRGDCRTSHGSQSKGSQYSRTRCRRSFYRHSALFLSFALVHQRAPNEAALLNTMPQATVSTNITERDANVTSAKP